MSNSETGKQKKQQSATLPGFLNLDELQNSLIDLTRNSWAAFFLTPGDLLEAYRRTTTLTLEQFLIQEAHVTRIELVQRILGLKGGYGFFVSNMFVDAGVAHYIPREIAQKLRIVPLATYDLRLYCLVEYGSPVDSLVKICNETACEEYTIIPLGQTDTVENSLDEVYRALERNDASHLRMGEFLLKRGQLTEEQLQTCLDEQKQRGGLLGEIMIRNKMLTEPFFYEALAALLEIPFYSSTEIMQLVDESYAHQFPLSYAKSNQIIALRSEADTAWLVTADPHNYEKIEAARSALRAHDVHLGVATPSSLLTAMNSIYYNQVDPTQLFLPVEDVMALDDEEQLTKIQAEIPRFLNYILYEGVKRKASDIHIERYEKKVLIKLRIDGHLMHMQNMTFLNSGNVQSLLAKIKVDAKLDIAEQRRPQDGVIRKSINSNIVDFRVAIVPTLWGENVVLRILNQSSRMPRLGELGLPAEKLQSFESIIRNPQGFILLTGPTGCGKTTTLYAILQELLETDKKIITAEDPIEYAIEGIQQSQVNEAIGNTFERYMRSFMRLDPDVILVGEIRDQETAAMAAKAAMTGHLVLSTLHVNDSVSTVRRLADLGVEANLISQTLLAVISQRLARKNCPNCSHHYEPNARLLASYFPGGLPFDVSFVHGTGCPACSSTGYSGRLAFVEFWQPGSRERSLIDQGAETNLLRGIAFDNGLKLLTEDALEKIKSGVTTIEELIDTVPMSQVAYYLELLTRNKS